MSQIDAPVKQVRYIELDSLRGLAALIVVLHHLRFLWQGEGEPSSPIGRAFLDLVSPFGTEAVMLFFVLSGFVLSLPAINGKPQTYLTFVIRRIFRIYVPYLAALAVAVFGAFWLHGIVTKSIWFHKFWSEPVDWRLVGQHVLFLGVFNFDQFDVPIWSLIHEMRVSLVFPFLCGFVLRFKSKWSLLIAGALTITAIIVVKTPFPIGHSVADTIHYAGFFVLGIFLARERVRLGAWFRRRPRIVRVLIGAAFVWLFLFAGPLLVRARGHSLFQSMVYLGQWAAALGAGGMMIISMNSAFCKRVLHWQPIRLLGQMSYSLYLWHFIVLLFCVHLLYGKTPLWLILCLAFVLSFPVSWCSYLWIEKPSMDLGRKLSNPFQRRQTSLSA